jgi:hypothetical protein
MIFGTTDGIMQEIPCDRMMPVPLSVRLQWDWAGQARDDEGRPVIQRSWCGVLYLPGMTNGERHVLDSQTMCRTGKVTDANKKKRKHKIVG